MWNEKNTNEQLIKGILRHGPEILYNCLAEEDITDYLNRLFDEKLDYPCPAKEIDAGQWFIPHDYQKLDIVQYLVDQCPPANFERLNKELDLYKKYNLLPVLRTMKYIVDTLKKNNVVWGVGRGSSVSSYVLYLLEVHCIDSVKYNLPLEEFFKGE